jgi:hypothetical protein
VEQAVMARQAQAATAAVAAMTRLLAGKRQRYE